MIVRMSCVHRVQPPVVDEVDMRTVLDGHVLLAIVTVRMLVPGDPPDQFLGLGIGRADLEGVLVDMAIMPVMEVAIMQEVDMPCMFESLMAARLPVAMAPVSRMKNLVRHGRCGKDRDRESGKKQGSVHDCELHKRRSRCGYS